MALASVVIFAALLIAILIKCGPEAHNEAQLDRPCSPTERCNCRSWTTLGLGTDVIERAQSPPGEARIADKAMVSQVAVIVGHEPAPRRAPS